MLLQQMTLEKISSLIDQIRLFSMQQVDRVGQAAFNITFELVEK